MFKGACALSFPALRRVSRHHEDHLISATGIDWNLDSSFGVSLQPQQGEDLDGAFEYVTNFNGCCE